MSVFLNLVIEELSSFGGVVLLYHTIVSLLRLCSVWDGCFFWFICGFLSEQPSLESSVPFTVQSRRPAVVTIAIPGRAKYRNIVKLN